MTRIQCSWLIGLLVAITASCDREVPVGGMDGQACTTVGDTKHPDDCTTCTCMEGGKWSCINRGDCNVGGSGPVGSGGTTSIGGSTGVGGETGCCLAAPICAEGDKEISGPEACPADASCYSNTVCCWTVWCMKATAQCDAMPVCDAGDTEVTGTCPPDLSCYTRTLCGSTINCRRNNTSACTPGATREAGDGCNKCTCDERGNWGCTQDTCSVGTGGATGAGGASTVGGASNLAGAAGQCAAAPICTPGDTQIQVACQTLDINTPCYERSMCGTTIYCLHNTATACTPGAARDAADGCSTCYCDANGAWQCTAIACSNKCAPGASIPATDGCNTCTCQANGTWSCTNKACTTCTPGVHRLVDGCNATTCIADTAGAPGWGPITEIGCGTCITGRTKPAGDNCNTCICTDKGTWSCTDHACPKCTSGDVAADGSSWCMNCTCNAAGGWQCGPDAWC